ncbi:MAG: ROK family protein, partial [Candidatus Omnitrophota bacterium]
VTVNSLYRKLGVDPLSAAASLTAEGYYRLAGVLSEMEGKLSIAENRNIRFAINLIFDFWDPEKRILEQRYLIQEIDAELRAPGSGRLPQIAAIQDLHGGERRAACLIGFILGLPADIYVNVSNLSDLKDLLVEYGIDVDETAVRFVGLNDKYDRGNSPVGVFNLVAWLREKGKAKPFIGNHDFWRTMGVLGIDLLFEEQGIDFKGKDVKNHHIASWAREAFNHAGWGDIELEQVNQARFNFALAAVNAVLQLVGIETLPEINLALVRSGYEKELKALKKQNSKIREQNELHKDDASYERQAELKLPDIFTGTIEYLRRMRKEYNELIAALNNQHGLDLPMIKFTEVDLTNYWRDPEIIARALWELKNFRLFYVDVLGNLHMHNIVPIDYQSGGFAVEYKGLKGLSALELMAEDVRIFFQDLETLPDSMVFRRKMWDELGEAFTIINSWYSDIGAYAKAVSVKQFIQAGGLEGLGHEILGHISQAFVDRESTFLIIWGHNERKKFAEAETALPWLYLYPSLQSGIANIDFEMSEGYSDRGAALTFFQRDATGKLTGLRKWGYRENSIVIEDLTLEDIDGMSAEQLEMLRVLSDGQSFMHWYKMKALAHIAEESQRLIIMAQATRRPDKEQFAKMTLEITEMALETAKGINPYPITVPEKDQLKAEKSFGKDKILTSAQLTGFKLEHPEQFKVNHYRRLQQLLKLLEKLLGRAPPLGWRLIITTDLSLTRGNVAACNIIFKTVYIHPYFFSLNRSKQLIILYHELISHIQKGIRVEALALEDTAAFKETMPLFGFIRLTQSQKAGLKVIFSSRPARITWKILSFASMFFPATFIFGIFLSGMPNHLGLSIGFMLGLCTIVHEYSHLAMFYYYGFSKAAVVSPLEVYTAWLKAPENNKLLIIFLLQMSSIIMITVGNKEEFFKPAKDEKEKADQKQDEEKESHYPLIAAAGPFSHWFLLTIGTLLGLFLHIDTTLLVFWLLINAALFVGNLFIVISAVDGAQIILGIHYILKNKYPRYPAKIGDAWQKINAECGIGILLFLMGTSWFGATYMQAIMVICSQIQLINLINIIVLILGSIVILIKFHQQILNFIRNHWKNILLTVLLTVLAVIIMIDLLPFFTTSARVSTPMVTPGGGGEVSGPIKVILESIPWIFKVAGAGIIVLKLGAGKFIGRALKSVRKSKTQEAEDFIDEDKIQSLLSNPLIFTPNGHNNHLIRKEARAQNRRFLEGGSNGRHDRLEKAEAEYRRQVIIAAVKRHKEGDPEQAEEILRMLDLKDRRPLVVFEDYYSAKNKPQDVKLNQYPLLVPREVISRINEAFGPAKILAEVNIAGLDFEPGETLFTDNYEVLKRLLQQLTNLLGRAPPTFRVVITTDLSLTEGNVAACGIDNRIVYIHPYFFTLLQAKQLEILYHELISHIEKGIRDEDEAMADTVQFRSLLARRKIEGLTVAISLLDLGAEIVNGEVICRDSLAKAIQMLYLLEQYQVSGVYIYAGLYEPSEISRQLHQVPTPLRQYIEVANTTVTVSNYTTKNKIVNGIELRDSFGNSYSIYDMGRLNPQLSSNPEYDLKEFIRVAHYLGIEVTVDFIPWLAPDAINEQNYSWTFHKELSPQEQEYYSSLSEANKKKFIRSLLEKDGSFAAVRINEGNERLVLVKHLWDWGINVDEVVIDPFNEEVRLYYLRSLRALIDLGADKVRVDLGHLLLKKHLKYRFIDFLGAQYGAALDSMPEPLKIIMDEAKAYAQSKGKNIKFIYEAYEDADRKELLELGAYQVYFKDLFDKYCLVANGVSAELFTNILKHFIFTNIAFMLNNQPKRYPFQTFPSNSDEYSLCHVGGARIALSMTLITLAYLGMPVMVDLREWMGHMGHIIPIVGGGDRHFFVTDEELASRDNFEKLLAVLESSIWSKLIKDFLALGLTDEQRWIEFPDNANLSRFVSFSWKTLSDDWIIYIADMHPSQDETELWVALPSIGNDFTATDVYTGEPLNVDKQLKRISGIKFKPSQEFKLLLAAWNINSPANSTVNNYPMLISQDIINRINETAMQDAEWAESLKKLLQLLEQRLGRAPPNAEFIFTKDLSLTQGNVAACNIKSKIVYLYPYFFQLPQEKQLEILYHELISHIEKGIRDENLAMRDTNAFTWLQFNTPELADKTLLTLSMEGNIPEFSEYSDAQNANTRGGLGAYFGDKLEGLFAIGLPSWGIEPAYQYIQRVIGGPIFEVDYGKLFEKGLIKKVLDKDGNPLVLKVYIWDDSNSGKLNDNKQVDVEIWLTIRGGTPLFLLHCPEVFDLLYTDYRARRFSQEVVLGKSAYQLMKKSEIVPDFMHLNEAHVVVAAAQARADSTFDKMVIVYTNHTLVSSGLETFEPSKIGVDDNRMMYLIGIPESKEKQFRPYFMRPGKIDFCFAAANLADIINGVSLEHGIATEQLFRDMYGSEFSSKVIGVLNGSGRTWVNDRLRAIEELGFMADEQSLYDIHEQGKQEALREVYDRTGITLDPNKATIWMVRRIVEYKSQYSMLRFLIHIICSDPSVTYTRDQLRQAWCRDTPDLLTDYNKQLSEEVLDYIFAHKEKVQGLGMQVVVGGPEFVDFWVKEFRRWSQLEIFKGKFIYVPNSDAKLLKMQAIGADICINIPRPLEEACGTSDQRTGLNGGVNIAIRGAGPVEWIVDYNMQTQEGSGFLLESYTFTSAEGAILADNHLFHRKAPADIIDKLEIIFGMFNAQDRTAWKGLMHNAYIAANGKVSAKAMEQRYAADVYLPALQEKNRNQNDSVNVAFSLGGSKLGPGAVNARGDLVIVVEDLKWQDYFGRSVKESKPEEILSAIVEQVEIVLSSAGIKLSQIQEIGVAFAGPVDHDSGIAGTPFAAPNLPFDHYPFKETLEKMLQERFGTFVPVEIYNDCEAAVMGELSPRGALYEYGSGTAMIIGTGINATAAKAGKPYYGLEGEIKELGHNLVPTRNLSGRYSHSKGAYTYTGKQTLGDHPKDDTGKNLKGDFEDTLSGPNLDRRFQREGFTLTGITREAAAVNPRAISLIEEVGGEIGQAIAAFIFAYVNEDFVRHIVLVSGVSENLGKGVLDSQGRDIFVTAVQLGALEELLILGLDRQEAEELVNGIKRSELGYERELLAFVPKEKTTQKNPYFLPVSEEAQLKAEEKFGKNMRIADIRIEGFNLGKHKAVHDDLYSVLQNLLTILENNLGRAPPQLSFWHLVITTDLSLTEGNIAACDIDNRIVYIHIHFFRLTFNLQLRIIYHELISHIVKKIRDEKAAQRDTRRGAIYLKIGSDFVIPARKHINPVINVVRKRNYIGQTDFLKIAEEAYGDRVFASGESYFARAKSVRKNLRNLYPKIDKLTQIAALLYCLEFSELKKVLSGIPELDRQQADRVIELVNSMNRVARIVYKPTRKGNFNIQNQINAIVQEANQPEVMLLVFAVKYSTIFSEKKSGHDYVYREAREIYAPLAERLGLDHLALKLRDQILRISYPATYAKIKAQIEARLQMSLEESGLYLYKVRRDVKNRLKNLGVQARVTSRVKSVYSIYEKIESPDTDEESVEDIDDLFGIRMIFKTEEDLWKASGIPLSFGEPIKGQTELKRVAKFGFEAFCVGVRDSLGRSYEFQFMTEENYIKYAYGKAAHWAYKTHRETGQNFDADEIKVTGDFFTDFIALRDSLKKWVFVFRQMEESGSIVFKPLRLLAQSISADYAALRDIDAFNKDFKGVAIYRVEYDLDQDKLIVSPKRIHAIDYQLQTLDVIDVLVSPNFLARSTKAQWAIKEKASYLRTILLLTVIAGAKLQAAKEEGSNILSQAGFFFNNHTIPNFWYPLAHSLDLKNEDELYSALVLTGRISLEQINDYAKEKGKQLLRSRGLNLEDEAILLRLDLVKDEFCLKTVDGLFIAVGSLQIEAKTVYERVYSRNIPVIIRPEAIGLVGEGIYYFELTCLDNLGLLAQITGIFKDLAINIEETQVKQVENGKVKIIMRIKIENCGQIGSIFERLESIDCVENLSSQIEALRAGGKKFSVNILAEDRVGLIYDITSIISGLGINMIELDSPSKEGKYVSLVFTLQAPVFIGKEDLVGAFNKVKNITFEITDLEIGEGPVASLNYPLEVSRQAQIDSEAQFGKERILTNTQSFDSVFQNTDWLVQDHFDVVNSLLVELSGIFGRAPPYFRLIITNYLSLTKGNVAACDIDSQIVFIHTYFFTLTRRKQLEILYHELFSHLKKQIRNEDEAMLDTTSVFNAVNFETSGLISEFNHQAWALLLSVNELIDADFYENLNFLEELYQELILYTDRASLYECKKILEELRLPLSEIRLNSGNYLLEYSKLNVFSYIDIYYKRRILLQELTRYRSTKSGAFALTPASVIRWINGSILSGKERIIDLGSGNAYAAALFAQNAARVTAIEIDRLLHQEGTACVADLVQAGKITEGKLTLINGDFFAEDFCDYDFIYIYWPFEGKRKGKKEEELRKRLEEKLLREMKPGAIFAVCVPSANKNDLFPVLTKLSPSQDSTPVNLFIYTKEGAGIQNPGPA